MMARENENIKKRECDFSGLLDSGELEAMIKFKDSEISEYKEKLNEERTKNNLALEELKHEIQQLKRKNVVV